MRHADSNCCGWHCLLSSCLAWPRLSAPAAPRADLSEQADPLHRAVPGGRRHRCCGARDPAAARKDSRPDGGDREPRRRRRRDRPRRRRQVRARWLHLRPRSGRRDERQSRHAGEDAVRCPQGPRGHQQSRGDVLHPGGAVDVQGQFAARRDRRGEGRARQPVDRSRRQRHLDVFRGAVVHHHGRCADRASCPIAAPRWWRTI